MPTNTIPKSNKTNFFDFCQQCSCFHQAYFHDGLLIMFPCQNSIHQPQNDQKVSSQTNLTSPNTQSTNSLSTLSIKNHLSPSVSPNVVRLNESRNLYLAHQQTIRPQQYSSKSPQSFSLNKSQQRPISIHKQQFSPNNLSPIQYQPDPTSQPKPQQHKPLSFHNQPKQNPLFQNTILPTKQPIQKHPHHLPIIFANANPFQQCTDTPQFGSQSRVSQNKQNTISSRRLIKQHKQFIIPKITQGRNQKTFSQISQQTDYFCCGYIKKPSK